jgi:hypothetical protein
VHSKRQVWVVVRYDEYAEKFESAGIEQRVTVVKVLDDGHEAEREATHLNELNCDKGCRYRSQVTRWLEPSGGVGLHATAGPDDLSAQNPVEYRFNV